MKRLAVALLLFFVVACSSSTTFSAQTSGDIVIVFDQSASMQEYTSRFMADLWISSFVQIFPGGHNISLVGFSEDVKEHLRIELKDESTLNKFRADLQKIPTSGLITDFEPPLKYLLKYSRQADLVVIITDGKPDIWDEKNNYLSRKIRRDPRYADFNSIYSRIYARSPPKSATKRRMFKSLKAGYESRNRALIDGHMKALRRKFSGKIVLLDVSGQHKYLTAWAKKIGAYYVKADIAGDKVSEEQLKKALVELQIISSKVLGKPLPAAFEKKIELLLESKTQPKQTVVEHTTATQQEPKSRKELYVVAALIALILSVCLYLFVRKGRKTADSGYEAVPAYTSLAAEQRQIEKQFSTADDAGNKDKLRFLRQVLEDTHFDKRFTLGVPVPPGTMHVIWKDPSGKIRKSPVIDISINSLLFEEPEFTAGKIDAIECILFDKEMIVKSSLQETRENRFHAVILEDFDDNLGDRMHWIEILTRIEEVG